jgi:serine/threonine protein kinase
MPAAPRIVGRYAIHAQIAAGGIATVHLGRQVGAAGFTRTVAIKKLHPQLAGEPAFVSMFLDEARLATRFRHPNVVPTLDIVSTDEDLFLVMEYVHGATLARLMRNMKLAGERVPLPVAAAILSGVLRGLHAAHEARNERGEPLDMVHRDVSPQNVMVGVDGMPRVLDFGIAKAMGRLTTTRKGELKGKFGYMAPEQLQGAPMDRRCDVYAASVVLWEVLAGRRLFHDATEKGIMQQVLGARVGPPSAHAPGLPEELDAIVLRGLAREPEERFATASEMANAIESAVPGAIAPAVGAWVERSAAQELAAQAALVREVELASDLAPAQTSARATAAPALAPSPAEPTYQTLVTGQVLAGKYRVDRVLGAGAMGKVLAATHVQLDARVALKVMLPEATSTPEASARFLREARAAAKLRSEHVAKVHDFGALADGTPYIVMELLDGRDLGALLAERGPLAVEEAADYVLQACDALAEAHAQGIVHRDLKPANLFVTARSDGAPVVKVLDFGVSKTSALNEPASLATSASALLGSPHYMAPEQLKSARDVDARADVWSIGVLLYQLTAGHVPFRAESLGQLMARVLTEPPVPLAKVRPGLPPEFLDLVASCLEKDVDRRCASVATIAAVLARFAPARSRPIADRVAATLDATEAEPPDAVTQARFVPAVPSAPATPEFGTVSGTVVHRHPLPAGDATHVMPRRKVFPAARIAIAAGGAVLVAALVGGTIAATRSHRDGGEVATGAASAPAPATGPEPALASAPALAPDALSPAPGVAESLDAGAPGPGKGPRPPATPRRAVPLPSPGATPSAAHSGPRYNPLDHL